MKSVEITIYGMVQGVFFRKTAKEKADKFNVNGTVRNLSDGTVYIEATASEANLNEFVGWCLKGPDSAEVLEVRVRNIALKNFRDFTIIH